MTQNRPDVQAVLETVSEFLQLSLLPTLDGDEAYQTRVCVNLLGMISRELREGAELDAAETERLHTLLSSDAPLDELNRDLATSIRNGTVDWRREDVRRHLMESAVEKLRVVNPAYLKS